MGRCPSAAAGRPCDRVGTLGSGGERTRQEAPADRTGASLRGRSVGRMAGQLQTGRQAGSGGSQPCQGATELGGQRLAMQGEAACRAGEPSGQREEPPPKGLGGHHLLAQTNPRRPAGQVVGHHLYRQPSAVGGEAAGRHVVQTDAVLEVSSFSISAWRRWSASSGSPFGDEAVIAVGGGGPVGRASSPAVAGLSPCRWSASAAPSIQLGVQSSSGMIRFPFVLADGDGEADIHLTTGGDESVGVEAAVGPRRKLPAGPGTANPAHRFTQEVGGTPSGVGAALAQPGHQHLAGAGGNGQQRVIAPLAGKPWWRPPPWPVRRSRRWWSPGQWSGARRRVPPRATPGPATRGSPGRVDGRGPSENCAGRCPGWMAP